EKSELLARSLLEALQKAEDQAAVAAKQRDYLLHALEAERRRAPGARGFGPKKLKGKPAQSFARVYGELLERSRRDLAAAENAADVAAVRAATLKAQQADLAVEIKALKAQAKKLGLPAKADPRYQELAVALNDVNQELARVAAGAFRSDAVTKFKQATATATATATKTSHDVEVQKLKEQVARLMAENRDLRRRIEGGERASTGTFFKHRNAAEFARSKAAFANLLRDIERASGAKRRDALKRLYAVARADSQREAAARLAELHERIMKLGDHVETLAVEKKIEAMRDAADALLKARRQFEQTLEKTMAAQGTPHRRDPK
ncbi:MAG: hypothetical protein OER88_01410, partial [Planctomycetota bacterium]|nr:hypothetical protein [Planctomycetota bacterium]